MAVATRTDPLGAYVWRIHDAVDQFRVWAGTQVYPLPTRDAPGERWLIGTAEDAWLRLHDELEQGSRHHAALVAGVMGWTLVDQNSKNGIQLDGEAMESFSIRPGAEIRVGSVKLFAESKLIRDLHELLCRFIGWSASRRSEVDLAIRNIRLAVTRHQPLVLAAEDSHIAIARLLHRQLIGSERPFVICERRGASESRTNPEPATPRAETFEKATPALDAAIGGTLVVRRNRLPDDFEHVLATVRDGARVLLIICTPEPPRGAQIHPQLIIPPLSSRMEDINRIMDVYAQEHGGVLAEEDRKWVLMQPKLSFATIETGTQRVLAIHASDGGVDRAAGLVDVAQSTFSSWLSMRPDHPRMKRPRRR